MAGGEDGCEVDLQNVMCNNLAKRPERWQRLLESRRGTRRQPVGVMSIMNGLCVVVCGVTGTMVLGWPISGRAVRLMDYDDGSFRVELGGSGDDAEGGGQG